MATVDFSKGYPCPMCGTLFPTWDAMNKHAEKEAETEMALVKSIMKAMKP